MALSFNGDTKIITLSTGTTSLSVRDLWSRWVDWVSIGDNSKYRIAMEQVGGNTIDATAGTFIPIYAFLVNGWRIKPQESDHILNVVDGILLVEGGGDPFISTLGDYTVRINYQQPVQAITVSTAGGGGTFDPDDLLDAPNGIEDGITLRQALRAILAVTTGKADSVTPTIIKFRDTNDTVDRVTMTVNSNGERSNVDLDL
jgi:hypothetical protein